jgi:hypothetical protein
VSPVARRQGGAHTSRAVLVAVAGVVAALGVAFLVADLASRGDVEVNLGDERFGAGRTENLARIIEEDGEPILFPDPANFTRAVYIDHSGGDPDSGWTAFGAFVPDDPGCALVFDPEVDAFVSDCDPSVTFPRSGAGLRQYPVEVSDGELYVDLQDPAPAS